MANSDMELEFDFSGRKQAQERQQEQSQRNLKFKAFKQIAVGALGVALLTGGVIATNNWLETRKAEKIQKVEQNISQSNQSVYGLMANERAAVQKTYANNVVLLSQYAGYKDLVDIMNLGNSLNKKMQDNASLYKKSLVSLDADKAQIDKVIDATKPTATKDIKEDVLLGGQAIYKFNEWNNNVKNKQFMYVGGLIELGKDAQKELELLETTKQDIIKTVQDKIKSKDYNLNETQSALANQVKQDASAEVNELKKVRSEIAGTDQDNLLTDKDVAEASSTMEDLQNEAIGKIAQDKATVEGMIAKMSTVPTPTVNNSANQAQNQAQAPTQSTSNSHQWGFFEYYLLYNWLAGGSSNSAAIAAANTNSFRPATPNTSNVVHNTRDLSNNATVMAATRTNMMNNPVNKQSANLYNFKDRNSYLNRTLSDPAFNKTAGTSNLNGAKLADAKSARAKMEAFQAKKPDVQALRAKVEQAKSKAVQANNMRQAELARARAAQASTAEAKAAQARAAQSAKNSSTSRSSFGSSSRGGSVGG